jgi:hypothetical protein
MTEQTGEGRELTILRNPADFGETRRDIGLLSKSVGSVGPVLPDHKTAILNRLLRIIDKESVAIACKDGGVNYDEDKADKNAIAAATVVQRMIGQNLQAERPATAGFVQPVVNVGVQVNGSGNTDAGRTLASAIAERIRANRISQQPAG